MLKKDKTFLIYFLILGLFMFPEVCFADAENKDELTPEVGYYSAKITWSTDEPSTSQVEYGESSSEYEHATTLDKELTTYHEVILKGLDPSTLYHYRVKSKDASGNETISSELTFKTLDVRVADNTPPKISNIKVDTTASLEKGLVVADEELDDIIVAGPTGPPAGNIMTAAAPQAIATTTEENSVAGQLTKHEEPVEKTLIQKGGLLLPKGRWQFEPSLTYAHISANSIVITGFTALPVLIIGEISSDKVKRDIFIETTTLRYGLWDNLQAEVRVPMRYQYERVTAADDTESTRDSAGLGDIEGGIYHQFKFEHGWVPDLIGGISVKSDSADESPYDNEGQPGLGTGHWGVKASLVAVKSSDPAIIFGSLNYTRNLKRDIADYGKVDPGDSFGYSLGMTFALNYQVALNLQIEQNVTTKMKIDGTPVNGSFTNAASFKYGLVWSITKNLSCDVSASHGLTEDSPDIVLEVRFPYSF